MRALSGIPASCTSLLVVFGALAFLVASCSAERAGEPSASPSPEPEPAAATSTISASPASPSTTTATPAATQPGRIVLGADQGELALRTVCADDYPSTAPGAGLRDGDEFVVISAANEACRGWAFVRTQDERSSWVRLRYLDGTVAHEWGLDLVDASWADLLPLLTEHQRRCVTTALLEPELAAAAGARMLDGGASQRWERRFFACLDHDLATAVGYARVLGNAEFTLGPLPDETRACVRRFVNEVVAIDRQALLSDAGALAEAIAVQNMLRPLCLRETLIDFVAATLVADLALFNRG